VRREFTTHLVDSRVPLIHRTFACQFPILIHDPAGEPDQDARWHKNGDEEQKDLSLMAGDTHSAQLPALYAFDGRSCHGIVRRCKVPADVEAWGRVAGSKTGRLASV
jgi:hypothetical protein